MDDIDNRIVQILRRDARTSVSNVSAQLGITRATVRSRVEKLQTNGEILGFTTVLRSDAYELPVRGIMLIAVEGKGTDRVISVLDGTPEVQSIHTTNGRWDLIIEFGTDTLANLDLVLRKIRLIDGISNSESNLYLDTKRSAQRTAKIPAAPQHRGDQI